MKRIDAILHHPTFTDAMQQIAMAERTRIFCGHDMQHLLAVARIMTILSQEGTDGIPRPLIYGAALLHDLGRGEEYAHGTPHEQASLTLARPILRDCGFDEGEQDQILQAIRQHRSAWQGQRSALGQLLYLADKKSRLCMTCPAAAACNWPMEKRNLEIRY